MIDLQKGVIEVTDDLIVCPNFTFEEFKKSRFYKNQDGIRIISLDEQQIIDNRKYVVSIFFRNKKIYMLSLICCDKEYSEEDEKKRKELHDEILEKNGVIGSREFIWGKISSDYDARSNCSSINVMYF